MNPDIADTADKDGKEVKENNMSAGDPTNFNGCCPHCGYCPHCGRSAAPVYPQPYLPQPYWQIPPQPYYPWTQPVWTGTGTITTVGTITLGPKYEPTSVCSGGIGGNVYFTS